jgi:5'-3' exonuclease
MIDMALLLGSDYTDGLKGVGGVLALEILAEFREVGETDPEPGTVLKRFAQWAKQQQSIFERNRSQQGTGTLHANELEQVPDTPVKKRLVRVASNTIEWLIDTLSLTLSLSLCVCT